MRTFLNRLLVPCVAAALLGCGSGDTVIESTPQETPAVKAMLQDIAELGEVGSGGYEIREQLEMMKTSGDAKADELLEDLNELESLSKPPAIKKKAAEMAEKL